MNIKKLTFSSLVISIGSISAHLFYIPVGPAKCFPIQHFMNVVSAVILGPYYGLSNAFLTSVIRNLIGTGSFLAFPGSMIGAYLSAILFQKYKTKKSAVFGEIIGTGIVGGILAFPIAKLLMGKEIGAFFFLIPFLVSSVGGSLLAYCILNKSIMSLIKKNF